MAVNRESIQDLRYRVHARLLAPKYICHFSHPSHKIPICSSEAWASSQKSIMWVWFPHPFHLASKKWLSLEQRKAQSPTHVAMTTCSAPPTQPRSTEFRVYRKEQIQNQCSMGGRGGAKGYWQPSIGTPTFLASNLTKLLRGEELVTGQRVHPPL